MIDLQMIGLASGKRAFSKNCWGAHEYADNTRNQAQNARNRGLVAPIHWSK